MRFSLLMLVAGTVVLNGCTSYYVGGYFEDTPQTFHGTVTVAMTDAGEIKVQSDDGSIVCEGSSQVVERPSGLSVIGARGRAQATCKDGRTFTAEFLQDRSTGGYGQGIDNTGAIVRLFFDKNKGTVDAALEQATIQRALDKAKGS